MVQSLSSPFITHHQPSLIWLTSRVARSSVASGRACRSSVVTSLLTKKLVVPTASLGDANCSPFLPVSEYLTFNVRANSVVANTLPRTDRAGRRLMRVTSPFKIASALSPLVICDQNFDPRNEGAVFKSRDCDGVNVTQIIWLYRADVIAKAATQGQAEHSRK